MCTLPNDQTIVHTSMNQNVAFFYWLKIVAEKFCKLFSHKIRQSNDKIMFACKEIKIFFNLYYSIAYLVTFNKFDLIFIYVYFRLYMILRVKVIPLSHFIIFIR